MAIKFYNTLTRKIQDFQPLKQGKVKLYTCGPTVYNTAHIGNFRTFLFEDLLKRYLTLRGFKVTHIMNLTDVDDRTINEANRTGEPISELTNKYIKQFNDDLQTLRVQPADHFPRATEHVREMIELVTNLMDRGYAYQAQDGSIFFAIDKYPPYGQLAHIDTNQQRSTERVESDDYSKENPRDFTLWKAWKPEDGEVYWDSPWGRGRPGWHIECSAMATKYLGRHFDIHCGGGDNIFPHHENEIAQSVCGYGGKFVNYWLHSEHLLLGDDKMSKSLGNFYRIAELLREGFTPESLRYVLLTTHYRSKLKFTLDKHHEAQKSIQRIHEIHRRLREFLDDSRGQNNDRLNNELDEFYRHMDNDLDIANGLAVIFDWIRRTNAALDNHELDADAARAGIHFLETIDQLLDILPEDSEVPEKIMVLVAKRTAARRDRDWALADDLRDQLISAGWEVKDTATGPEVHPLK